MSEPESTVAPIAGPTRPRPPRLWPGVVLVALQFLLRFAVPVVAPEAGMVALLGALGCALGIVVWWVFFSRTPAIERWGSLLVIAGGLFATPPLLHPSIATGAMGFLFYILVVPFLCLALVAGAALGRGLAAAPRRLVMLAALLLAFGGFTLLRTGGFTGSGENALAWRWSATAEERLLARAADLPTPAAPTAPAETPRPLVGDAPLGEASSVAASLVAAQPTAGPAGETAATPPPAAPTTEAVVAADWPGFRGPGRDGVVTGVRIETDWSASPPVELWRRSVGPGWSSFAVRGDRFYTQEQRGDDEVVACYALSTGDPLWGHRDATRFWESNAGAGPRGTPTLSGDRVYSFGATGIVNALDATSGARVWWRDAAADAGTEVPDWGYSSSPLLLDDLVVVASSGRLVAYDIASGEPRWLGPAGGVSYSSPQAVTIDGTAQILLLSQAGAQGVAPADGALLWEHAWTGYPIVQPARTADGDLLISVTERDGIRRLAVANDSGTWTVAERWTSIRLKPYFNDFVVHQGHAYGFDGTMLAAIDLTDGERTWKGGRFGHGQLVLLADQSLLLVLSEKGELALVAASPDGFTELARMPAIEGKTWNHPVLTGDVLLVRNDREMAAFRLAPATG